MIKTREKGRLKGGSGQQRGDSADSFTTSFHHSLSQLFFFPSFGEQISYRIYTRTNMATSCAHESTCRYTGVTLHLARAVLGYTGALFRKSNAINKVFVQFNFLLIFFLNIFSHSCFPHEKEREEKNNSNQLSLSYWNKYI